MKNKKLMAGILSVSMMLAVVGCGEKEETKKDSDTSSVAEVTTAENVAEEPAAADGDDDFDIELSGSDFDFDMNDNDLEEEEPASPEELAEVQELLKKYEKALNDNDYETIADITDLNLLYEVSEGEEKDRDTIISILKGETDSEDVFVPTTNLGTSFGEPRCYNSAAKVYNDFLSDPSITAMNDVSSKYTIDGLYMYNMSSSSTTDPDENNTGISGDFNFNMDMYILRINGEWKIDCGYGMMVDFANMFSNMSFE